MAREANAGNSGVAVELAGLRSAGNHSNQYGGNCRAFWSSLSVPALSKSCWSAGGLSIPPVSQTMAAA